MSATATLPLTEIAAQWRAARRIYPVYAAIARSSELGLVPCGELENLVDRNQPEALERIARWFDQADARFQAQHLRQALQTAHLATEENLRALLTRHLEKEEKAESDRDKIDFLLVQYFSERAPHRMLTRALELDDLAEVLEPVLGECSVNQPAWLAPLDQALEELRGCRSLPALLNSGVLGRVRALKTSAGAMFYGSAALLAFTRFNFAARQTFFRLLQSHLQALREALREVEKRGTTALDCSRVGLSAEEPLASIRAIVADWKSPFRAPYDAGKPFQSMVALLEMLEDAATAPVPVVEEPPAVEERPDEIAEAAEKDAPAVVENAVPVEPVPEPETVPAVASSILVPTPAEEPAAAGSDVQAVLEQISEQLIGHEPKTPTSVASVHFGAAKLILSSWEVAAYVQGGNDAADALQRGTAARALLLDALERSKQGDRAGFAEALAAAHAEAAQMQERVAEAKDAKNIDAAVNLAATAKRLLALIQEAEKLGQ